MPPQEPRHPAASPPRVGGPARPRAHGARDPEQESARVCGGKEVNLTSIYMTRYIPSSCPALVTWNESDVPWYDGSPLSSRSCGELSSPVTGSVASPIAGVLTDGGTDLPSSLPPPSASGRRASSTWPSPSAPWLGPGWTTTTPFKPAWNPSTTSTGISWAGWTPLERDGNGGLPNARDPRSRCPGFASEFPSPTGGTHPSPGHPRSPRPPQFILGG